MGAPLRGGIRQRLQRPGLAAVESFALRTRNGSRALVRSGIHGRLPVGWTRHGRKEDLVGHNTPTIGVFRDERCLGHRPGPFHPESPRRLEVLFEVVDGAEANLVAVPASPVGEEELAWIHAGPYIQMVREACAGSGRALDPDTFVGPGSWEACMAAVGGVFGLLEALHAGRCDVGIALVRPPGHHAEWDRAMGFCVFNNVALGARYAQRRLGYTRVMVVDWDLHHGNGTQDAFFGDPSVLYVSLHQYPHYPGTGRAEEVGEGDGRGYTVNIPLPAGSDDEVYAAAFNDVVLPAAEWFAPHLILVSMGFDIHWADPLGDMRVTGEGIAYMTARLRELAAGFCHGRVLFCLEGGYSPVGLREGLRAVLQACSSCADGHWHRLSSLSLPSTRAVHQIHEQIRRSIGVARAGTHPAHPHQGDDSQG